MTSSALAANVRPATAGATVQLVTRTCSSCGRAETIRQVVSAGWKPAASHVCASCDKTPATEADRHPG